MSVPSLVQAIAAALSPIDLACRLGAVCLDDGAVLADQMTNADVRRIADVLEKNVGALGFAELSGEHFGRRPLDLLRTPSLERLITLADANPPVGHLAVLRGLCRRALPQFFAGTDFEVVLDRGMPVPYPRRPINRLFPDTTPHWSTLSNGHLLQGLGFRVFGHSAGARIRVVLDYRWRRRLDELTWGALGRLPRVATLHPALDIEAETVRDGDPPWFFDARPRTTCLDALLSRLREARDVEIGILPELSLTAANALEPVLRRSPGDYPPLIVAGSAHIRERSSSRQSEVRANESRVYLDGQLIAVHRKIHPFLWRRRASNGSEQRLIEGLTDEAKSLHVLAGDHTRLAVVICSDLNDELIPRLLEEAGVNLLLVPALTTGEGAFNGAICELASRCQALSVIVNAAGGATAGAPRPFHAMVAVPRADANKQSTEYWAPGNDYPALGVIDPNRPLSEAMTWLARLPQPRR